MSFKLTILLYIRVNQAINLKPQQKEVVKVKLTYRLWDVAGIVLIPMLSWQSGPKPLLNEFGIHHSLKTCDLSMLAFRWVSFINKIVVISATQIEHWDILSQGRKKEKQL